MQTDIEISREDDRVTVAGILVKNGYTVSMGKRLKTPKGKAVVYFLHVEDGNKDSKED